MNSNKRVGLVHPWSEVLLAVVLFGALGCDGKDGAAGPAGVVPKPPPDAPIIKTDLSRDADLPGFEVAITQVSGGTGPGGNFRPGDTIRVTYTFKLGDGTRIPLEQTDSASILVSGPTSNYQRVIESTSDLRAESITNGDGSYTYVFAVPIPDTYLPPLNDTTAFGIADGELQGLPLLDGTYTVGIQAYKTYTVLGSSYRDAGNATKDFLLGNATLIEPRDVVGQENCNQCHTSLRVHGGSRRNVSYCVLCHTAGSEDKNELTVEGGTPGVSVDFKVLIHRIHNGAHLPSVLGVTTNADGTRKYDATPKPYKVIGFRNSVHDYSKVGFPVWPNLSDPLPRDEGYTALSSTEKGLEDAIRSGSASCAKCHGDPDGAGPLVAPTQGDKAFGNPSRAACGSCHDDVDWTKSYRSNMLIMPPQPNNSLCVQCHPADNGLLATKSAHAHPLLDKVLNPGVVFAGAKVLEAGTNNGNGKLDPGEAVRMQFTLQDESARPVLASALSRMEVVVAGPTSNRNILLEESFPVAAISGSTIDTMVPQKVFLEYLGDAKTGGGGTFPSAGRHWNISGATTTVRVRTTPVRAASSTLKSAAVAGQNYCDVVSGAGFARGDYIVVDDGNAGEEYLRVQFVESNRLWFSSTHGTYDQPALRTAHGPGVAVDVVALDTKVAGTDYSLVANTGVITELVAFGAGRAVLVSYTTDFVIPATYPTALNASPDLDESSGKWTGKTLVSGTYSIGVWGERDIGVKVGTETTTYHSTSNAAIVDFLLGTATKIAPVAIISSESNCYSCHDDMRFHGGHRRGVGSCLLCHGTAGSEDRPAYVAANATPTTGVSISFRRMLHKIHKGHDLANASTYGVNGFGSGYPNNFRTHTYEHVGFPSMPGGTQNCASCHGATNVAWKAPAARNHPTEQVRETRVWERSCGSCHDSSAAQAHIAVQTSSSGAESCSVCHGSGKEWSVELMHKRR